MKKNVIVAIVAVSAALFSTTTLAKGLHGCASSKTVYSAYTLKHSKAVELCDIGNNKFRYSFGPIGKPEIVLTKDRADIEFVTSMAGGFGISNGAYEYTVYQSKYGDGSLVVYKNDKQLAEIELDTGGKGYEDRSFEYRN